MLHINLLENPNSFLILVMENAFFVKEKVGIKHHYRHLREYRSPALLTVPSFAFCLCSDSPRCLLHNHEFAASAEKLGVTKRRSLRTVVEWDHLLRFQSDNNVSSTFRSGAFFLSHNYLSFLSDDIISPNT
jgi:hypothetical protein